MLSWNKLLRLVTICQHAVPFSLLMSALLNTPAVYCLTELKKGEKTPCLNGKVNINVPDSYQKISTGLTASIWIVLKPCPHKFSCNSPLSIAPGPCSRQPRYQSALLSHSSWCSRVDEHTQKSSTPHISEFGSSLKITSRLENLCRF